MSAVTNRLGVAVGSAADSFFRLRPSGFCAPERPLLQRRLAGLNSISHASIARSHAQPDS